MKLAHYMKAEKSGLAFTTLELVAAEQKLGHEVFIKEPSGGILYGREFDPDIEIIHSQLPINSYGNDKPRVLWCHGEPLSSVGNGVSMRAIIDLAPLCSAFICMRKEEHAYWNTIKKTYVVQKGIDLTCFRPLSAVEAGQKLSGAPSVLYMEHWRGQRNPLPLVIAMGKVFKKYPDARLHLYNCTDKKMSDTFMALVKEAKLGGYVRSLQGAVNPAEVNGLLNRVDMVCSCLHPLYARSIEAFGAGKPLIAPGYTDPEYPWHCDLDPDSMADAIIRCWEDRNAFDYRGWAEKKHDVLEMARQSIEIYKRFI